MQHVSHRASDARATPVLGRDVLNKIGQQLRHVFEPDFMPPMPERMAEAVRKLESGSCGKTV